MAKLTTKQRKQLPSSAFAIPEKRAYPIHDRAHARDALSRVSADGTPEEQARVRAAVKKRYPGMTRKRAAAKRHLDAGNITSATYRGMMD